MPAAAATPMLVQYQRIKEEYPGCLLFFRLGDFFELFGEDAELAARELKITLTSREAGKGRRIPMCGVPHHAVDNYIAELVHKGYRVAVCEQLEDPRTAKGVVKRDVVRVVTPGTILDQQPDQNRYLAAIAAQRYIVGLAACDLSTGEFICTQLTGDKPWDAALAELSRLGPSELLVADIPSDFRESLSELGVYQPETDGRLFVPDQARQTLLDHFNTHSLAGFGCENWPQAIRAAGGLLSYLGDTQKTTLQHITKLQPYHINSYMLLDAATRRNLELTQTIRTGQRQGSLLWVLDRTATAMGARLLRQWLEQPLLTSEDINRRLDCVQDMCANHLLRAELGRQLREVYDIERLAGRLALGTANGRDLLALGRSLQLIPAIAASVQQLANSAPSVELTQQLDPCEEVVADIMSAIVDEPPVSIREGNLIRPGYSDVVDNLRAAQAGGQAWIADLEEEERERTGIRSLKVGFNRVFGYYIEVTKPNLSLVPDDYTRKQTLANAERFVTPALKEKEALILNAEERVVELEYQLFCALRSRVAKHIVRLQKLAVTLAQIDVFRSLAEVAVERRYTRPTLNTAGRIDVKEGRHPVVEATLANQQFVPNDIALDSASRQIIIITGPNMAGKSTYLRQTALIVLMAHVGSFVPAEQADIPLIDRIFTRVGAADDLATGQSTFMVEMNEVANILHNATKRSLVILDEVGRGTSTFDGLSIAWAVTEYLHSSPVCRPLTLFATHYHELTELTHLLSRVENASVAVREEAGQIIFLRRITPGGTNRSYGIDVARLAGLPNSVIATARRILSELESSEQSRLTREMMSGPLVDANVAHETPSVPRIQTIKNQQLALFDPPADPLLHELASIDINELTPLAALNLLYDMCQRARRRVGANEGEGA